MIDLHSSVRSRLLSLLFAFRGIGVFRIVKGRKEKQRQIRQKRKILTPLPHTVDRYLKVFENAGYPASVRKGPWINVDPESKIFAKEFFESQNILKKESLWIGFAPFAGHALKEWPREKSKTLLQLLLEKFPEVKIFLFGSKDESKILSEWSRGFEESLKIVSGGKLGIRGELGIMEIV